MQTDEQNVEKLTSETFILCMLEIVWTDNLLSYLFVTFLH